VYPKDQKREGTCEKSMSDRGNQFALEKGLKGIGPLKKRELITKDPRVGRKPAPSVGEIGGTKHDRGNQKIRRRKKRQHLEGGETTSNDPRRDDSEWRKMKGDIF